MATKKFRIIGRISDRETQQGVAGLLVEAWDKDTFFNDLVGSQPGNSFPGCYKK